MRVRAKISFMALEKRMTIIELFAHTIQKCLRQLIDKGYLQDISEEEKSKNQWMIEQLMKGQIKGFMKGVIQYNFDKLVKNQ